MDKSNALDGFRQQKNRPESLRKRGGFVLSVVEKPGLHRHS